LRPELRDHVVKVVHLQREVLADCRGWFALDEMDLLVPGVEPGTGEPEVRTVFSAYQPQLLDVEVCCLIDVADVDRDVMYGDRSHAREHIALAGSAGIPDDRRVMTPSEPTGDSGTTPWSAATVHPGLWLDPADDPRDTGAELTDERDTLSEYLRAYRLTLEMKCADLDAEQLARRSVPPSTLSLLGLVRHMAEVERSWFRRVMAGQDPAKLYCTDDNSDGDFDDARADPSVVEQAWSAWRDEVDFAEQFTRGASDLSVVGTLRTGGTIQLREVLVHMLEEYARHCGHADLLRERIDGRIGQ
jgi:uncharacterized damage-inducible protein DinB